MHMGIRRLVQLTFALFAIASVVSRVADAIICIPLLIASLVTARRYKKLNDLAMSSLTFPAIISDLFTAVLLMVNPQIE